MLTPVLILALAVALIALWMVVARYRRAIRFARELGEGARAGVVSRLAAVDAGGGEPWVEDLAELLGEFLSERESLQRGCAEARAYRGLLAEVGLGLLLVNDELEIEFANRAVGRLFPGQGEAAGRKLIEIVLDHRLVQVVADAISGGVRCSRELRQEEAIKGEGTMRDRVYEVEAAPLADDAGAGCWVTIQDVTERVITEQVRKDFVANASHELRTPLTLIRGYIEALEDGMVDDRTMALKSLAIMRKHGERIMRIIEDMLTISKLEDAENRLRLKSFDVAACAEGVVDHLSSLIEEKKASVELKFSQDDRFMVGDRFYWDQVFINLIENALKQNQREGLVIKVSLSSAGRGFVISVEDNGVGIPRADLPFIFNRFYRGAKHHSQEIKGTGLGLSIVKRAVEAHGGSVCAESTPGVRTRFTVTVPLLEAESGDDVQDLTR